MAELGLRYLPAGQSDRIEHAEKLRLLTQDLSEQDPQLLAMATRRWVQTKGFLPKVSELIALCGEAGQAIREHDAQPMPGDTIADRANRRLEAAGKRPMWAMRGEGNGATCDFIGTPSARRSSPPFTRAELLDWSQAPTGSMRATFFRMGRSEGWIVPDGAGGWRDGAA